MADSAVKPGKHAIGKLLSTVDSGNGFSLDLEPASL